MKEFDEKKCKYYHECHGHFNIEEASLLSLLVRCGYIAEKKSGRQRGQNRILNILLDTPKISQKSLQKQLGIEPGSISEIISKMEQKGLLRREKDEEDRRKMIVCLTEKGRAMAEESRQGREEEDYFSALQPEEQLQLKKMIQKLLVQWKKERTIKQKMEEDNHG